MQPPTVREVTKRLESEGWRLARWNGDHRVYVKGGKAVPVAGKMGQHLDRGTWASIKRSVGW